VNDENFILIEGNRDHASQYAGKINNIHDHYRWHSSVQADHDKPKWQALATTHGRSAIRTSPMTSAACASSISGSGRDSGTAFG
jgi:hypothetical protein